MQSVGKVVYDAYFNNCGGKSLISGAPLPTWEGQSEAIKAAWDAAGRAVIEVTQAVVDLTQKEQ